MFNKLLTIPQFMNPENNLSLIKSIIDYLSNVDFTGIYIKIHRLRAIPKTITYN